MSRYIEWNFGPETEAYNTLIKKVIAVSLAYESVSIPIEVSIMIVDNNEIRSINCEQRDKDVPTDVLSFPMTTYEDGMSIEASISQSPPHPETGEYYLGDIVISWEKVIEQSQSYGHSLERELAFLVAHSMLHLLGYDHMVEEEEKAMIAKQKEIMNQMGLSR